MVCCLLFGLCGWVACAGVHHALNTNQHKRQTLLTCPALAPPFSLTNPFPKPNQPKIQQEGGADHAAVSGPGRQGQPAAEGLSVVIHRIDVYTHTNRTRTCILIDRPGPTSISITIAIAKHNKQLKRELLDADGYIMPPPYPFEVRALLSSFYLSLLDVHTRCGISHSSMQPTPTLTCLPPIETTPNSTGQGHAGAEPAVQACGGREGEGHRHVRWPYVCIYNLWMWWVVNIYVPCAPVLVEYVYRRAHTPHSDPQTTHHKLTHHPPTTA